MPALNAIEKVFLALKNEFIRDKLRLILAG